MGDRSASSSSSARRRARTPRSWAGEGGHSGGRRDGGAAAGEGDVDAAARGARLAHGDPADPADSGGEPSPSSLPVPPSLPHPASRAAEVPRGCSGPRVCAGAAPGEDCAEAGLDDALELQPVCVVRCWV